MPITFEQWQGAQQPKEEPTESSWLGETLSNLGSQAGQLPGQLWQLIGETAQNPLSSLALNPGKQSLSPFPAEREMVGGIQKGGLGGYIKENPLNALLGLSALASFAAAPAAGGLKAATRPMVTKAVRPQNIAKTQMPTTGLKQELKKSIETPAKC